MASPRNNFIYFYSLKLLVEELRDAYGFQYWWPAESPFEVIEGAILAQNTSWKNAEKSVFKIRDADASQLMQIGNEELHEKIRHSGFHRNKAIFLKNAASFYNEEIEIRPSFIDTGAELIGIRGIGKETADSIALYAFHQRTFPVDSYTVRLLDRYFGLDLSIKDYEMIRDEFIRTFPTEMLMEAHALIDEHSKKYCRKKPLCSGCYINKNCTFYQ